jgi:hypothetical protein
MKDSFRIITRRRLSRRALLRGAGASIALPFLDAMQPALAANSQVPLRVAFVYVPNGVDMRFWRPQSEGSAFDLPRILEPLAPHQRAITVLSGLTHNGARALGDGPGDHARAAAAFLTGVHPRKTDGADIQNGVSVDQVAAQRLGAATRFASLELGLEDGRQVGNCDSGYSCAYTNNISWRTPQNPMPPETNPRLLFERLFGAGEVESAEARARRAAAEKSILDAVASETARLRRALGPSDQRKLDEYLHAVRDIERRIERSEKEAAALPPFDRPEGYPAGFAEHARLMFQLMAAAFQSGQTRIATFMMGREGSARPYREIGISDGHHPLTHHQNNAEMMEKVARINCYHMQQFAFLLDYLKSQAEGDATLLDNSLIVYGSAISDGNRHTHHDLPVLLAGGGNRFFRSGRHVVYPKETPMANLYLNILEWLGIPTEKLGDSTGPLDYLSL